MEEIQNRQNDIQPQNNMEEQEIDLMELAMKLWAERKMILKWCGWAALVGLIVAFSIPKEYEASVTLAPESNKGRSISGGMAALAGMAGINLGGSSGPDALSPELYPDIVKSVPFSVEMFDVKVTDKDGELNTTLYEYLKEEQKQPWWGYITAAPFKALGWVVSTIKGEDEEEGEGEGGVDSFRLTKDQSSIITALGNRIAVSVDKKTFVITITTTMQDPVIAATVTNEVKEKLQNYITEYRTNKARKDLEFTEKLYAENMETYHKAQQEYAQYMDRNQNVSLRSAQTQQERLRNEMELAFNVYNQTAQQLQMAKAKVQEDTPVFTVVEAATVPLRAAKPSKAMILIGFVFLAAVGAGGWILFGREFVEQFRAKSI